MSGLEQQDLQDIGNLSLCETFSDILLQIWHELPTGVRKECGKDLVSFLCLHTGEGFAVAWQSEEYRGMLSSDYKGFIAKSVAVLGKGVQAIINDAKAMEAEAIRSEEDSQKAQ